MMLTFFNDVEMFAIMFAIMFNLFFHDVKDAFKHSYHQVNRTVSLFAGISNGCSLFTFCYATFLDFSGTCMRPKLYITINT